MKFQNYLDRAEQFIEMYKMIFERVSVKLTLTFKKGHVYIQ